MTYTSGSISVLANIFDETLDDTCIIYTFVSGTANTYNASTLTYSTGSAVDCGFKPSRAFTNYLGQLVVPEYDAELRLSLQTVLADKDLVWHENIFYDVEGINKGLTGKVVVLKQMKVT